MAVTEEKLEPPRVGLLRRLLSGLGRLRMPRLRRRDLRGYLSELMPQGLYARALIIIIAPIVILEGVVAFSFMERHWQQVTRRLSEATARDIAALIEVYHSYGLDDDYARLIDMARDRLGITMGILPPGELPPPTPQPFFALLDRTLSAEIRRHVAQPFWIDTVGQSRHVEVRIKLDHAVLRFLATRSQTYASNSHIFLIWMVGSSIVLLSVAILFLRNQIKPILRLAEAADGLGKGRPIPKDFKPRGAREVRQATLAFIGMSDRVRQHVEQRTTMLAGVSHDLRTVLTRFKLALSFLGDRPEVRALRNDANEMQHMLEDYLAFARGDGGEQAVETKVRELVDELHADTAIFDTPVSIRYVDASGEASIALKRNAFKRALTNLVSNAARFGTQVDVVVGVDDTALTIDVIDDGPGIPEAERENVFRPFYRLDHARNQNEGNSGLGLAIARDIARSHGGDITLADAGARGLKATLSVPV